MNLPNNEASFLTQKVRLFSLSLFLTLSHIGTQNVMRFHRLYTILHSFSLSLSKNTQTHYSSLFISITHTHWQVVMRLHRSCTILLFLSLSKISSSFYRTQTLSDTLFLSISHKHTQVGTQLCYNIVRIQSYSLSLNKANHTHNHSLTLFLSLEYYLSVFPSKINYTYANRTFIPLAHLRHFHPVFYLSL